MRVLLFFFACVDRMRNFADPSRPHCAEVSAYPADNNSKYGWEKLFSERLYLAHNRNHDMRNRVACYHKVFDPFGARTDGREKARATVCRRS